MGDGRRIAFMSSNGLIVDPCGLCSRRALRETRLERDLAARYGDDREAYTDAKRAFVQTVINNRKDGFGVGE